MPLSMPALLELLDLERIEDNLFRGASRDPGWGRLFGGQVLGQALAACERTVEDGRPVHSLHAYFLREGDTSIPVVYTVDRLRDGRSFSSRRVVAIQKGKAILNLAASFHVAEPGAEHGSTMPEVPPPEDLLNHEQLAERYFSPLTARAKEMASNARPVEIRPVDPVDPRSPAKGPARRQVWMRCDDRLPDDPRLHRHLLAYASDFTFFTTALQPHGVSFLSPQVQIASLDHAMWFHCDFRFDDWMLYDIDSPAASGATGLVRGRFFTRGGKLVASTAQEGLMRIRTR